MEFPFAEVTSFEDATRNFEHLRQAALVFGGQGTFLGNGTATVTFDITHNLQRIPTAAFVGALGWVGAGFVASPVTSVDIPAGAISAGAVFANATPYGYYWMVLG